MTCLSEPRAPCITTCLLISHINYSLLLTLVYLAYLLPCINVLSVRNGINILDTNPLFLLLYLQMYLQGPIVLVFDHNLVECGFNSFDAKDISTYNVQ